MEIEKKYILSPTSGLAFSQECKRCWWLSKNTDWNRPTYGFPGLPGGMDEILKKYYDEFRTKNLLPPFLREKECQYQEIIPHILQEAHTSGLLIHESSFFIKEKGLFANPSAVQWGQIPKKD